MGQLAEALRLARAGAVAVRRVERPAREDPARPAENRRELGIAKRNLQVSQRVIAQRLVALYTSDQTSTLEVILGAKSLDDMINRMDSAKSVTSLDANVLAPGAARSAPRSSATASCSQSAQVEQQAVVAAARRREAAIESKIAQQQQPARSIKGQIASMIAAEQRSAAADGAGGAGAPRAAAPHHAAAGARDRRRDHRGDSDAGHRRRAAVDATAASSGSRCRSSARRTSGAAQRPAGSTARASSMWAYAQVGVSLPHSTYAQYAMGVAGLARPAPAGRHRLLRRARPRRHLHRRRPVHPRAAHRRRRQDLEPRRRLVRVDLRRRPPHPLGRAYSVELFDVLREVVEDHLAAELQRRRDLVVLEREVAREDREALDLLEARPARR